MPFFYFPEDMVQPYKIFGMTLYAVESVCADEHTGTVRRHQHIFLSCPRDALQYAGQLRSGEQDDS